MRITSDQRGLSGGLTALLSLALLCIAAILFASTFRTQLPTNAVERGDEALGPGPPPQLLYSQYNNPATQPPLGIGSQKFEPANDALTDQAADDFPACCSQGGYLIETVNVMGEYSAGGGPASAFNVYFYTNAAGNVPGSLFNSALNRPYTATPPNFSIDVGGTFLANNTRYWISVQAVMDQSHGQWFWHNRTVQSADGAAWQNPGNGYGTGCLVWNRKNTCMPDQVWPDQVFSVYGFSIPTPTATGTATPTATASPTPTVTATATATPPNLVVTNINDSGPGSLRQALADAQDGDIIGFNSSLNGQVIGLTGSQLVINKNITIRGPGLNLLTVSRTSGTFRIFIVTPGHSVAISGLTIRGGKDDGGGIYNDHSTVTLNHCSVRENLAGDFNSGGGRGAGIYNNGFEGSASMTIVNSAVNDNRADRAGGGIYNDGNNGLVNVSIINSTVDHNTASFIGGVVGDGDGGGIYNGGQVNVMISSSSVSTNSSGAIGTVGVPGGSGGGIYGGTLTISNSIINGNSAQYQSGGIHGAYVTITNSTVNNNQVRGFKGSAGPGGGMWINGGTITNSVVSGNFAGSGGGISGSATIVNSTISNNVAIQDGGGIAGESVMTNCTISHNSADRGGGIYRGGTIAHSTISDNNATQGGGIYVVSNSMLEISDTILKSGSMGSNLFNGGGAISSHGYNLSNDNGGGFLTEPGDQINIDPLLGPLQDNGGQTFTHALLNGSPAIDAGNPGFTPPPFTDQRCYLRVYNGRIDIGSFELQPNITPTPSPTPLPATHFEIDAPPTVLGGVAFSISVTAKDKFNNTATSYSGIVHFTSSDASANLPPDSFLVNGIAAFMPALISSGPQTITVTDTADPSITGTTDPIFVKAEPTPTASPVTPTPTPTPSPTPTLIVTNTNDTGPGSLRQALADVQDGDVIGFSPALNGQTIILTTGELVINKSVIIDGPGPELLTIKRDPQASLFRIFHILAGTSPTIRDLTITGGFTSDARGGGILNEASLNIANCHIHNNYSFGNLVAAGGGIYSSGNNGVVVINQCTISDNGALIGGGISNVGLMEISNSAITGNHAYLVGFSFGSEGGGIDNRQTGTLTINDSVVSGNTAGEPIPFATATPFATPPATYGTGGGIRHFGNTTLTISHSVINDNTVMGTGGEGGGILGGPINIIASTISNNHADNRGGGINAYLPITIADSTISNNTAGDLGSGILIGWNGSKTSTISSSTFINNDIANLAGGLTTQISNCTISSSGILNTQSLELTHNTVSDGSIGNFGGITNLGSSILKNTTFANSSGGTVSLGYNLNNGTGSYTPGPGDLFNTDPLLGPLQNNGGPTLTYSVLKGSPAINAGDLNFTPPPLTDQRGYLRVYDGRIDIGSVEVQPVPTPTPSPSASPTPTPSTAQALNISTRLRVETGDNVGIGGFIISGAGDLRVVIRGLGPSLGQLGVPDFLADPVLEGLNDNWQDDPDQAAQLMKLGLAPINPLESAIVETLPPGAHTAILSGKNGGTGVGLVEVYNVDSSVPVTNIELANISTRGLVQTGNNVMIGGFILGSGSNSGIVVRGIGPSLSEFGVPNALTDPTLELRDNNGALLVANDNWQDDPASAAQLSAHGLAPSNPNESGIFLELQPNLYTAILGGKNGGVGVGLVEIYHVH